MKKLFCEIKNLFCLIGNLFLLFLWFITYPFSLLNQLLTFLIETMVLDLIFLAFIGFGAINTVIRNMWPIETLASWCWAIFGIVLLVAGYKILFDFVWLILKTFLLIVTTPFFILNDSISAKMRIGDYQHLAIEESQK